MPDGPVPDSTGATVGVSARPIRVLFVIGSLSTGGAERFVSTCLGFLDRARFAPMLAAFRPDMVYPLPDDVPLLVLGKHRPWHNPRAMLRLAHWVDAERPDVVLSGWSYPNLFTAAALGLARHRPGWIARVARDPGPEETGLFRLWARVAYRRTDRILANSQGLAGAFADAYPFARDRLAMVRNPTDFAAIDWRASAPCPAPMPVGPVVLWAGRLVPQKRPDLAIEAFARVARDHAGHLVMLGEGPERAKVGSLIAARGLRGRVTLAGFCDNPYAAMARADLFLLTSDDEGLPNALIEAQGLGLPAVSTDCPYGPSEIVADGATGRLVPVGDAAALAAAMAELLGDPGRRAALGRAARARARRRFALAELGARISALLEEVARAHGGPDGRVQHGGRVPVLGRGAFDRPERKQPTAYGR